MTVCSSCNATPSLIMGGGGCIGPCSLHVTTTGGSKNPKTKSNPKPKTKSNPKPKTKSNPKPKTK
jgi:hypothetical protein